LSAHWGWGRNGARTLPQARSILSRDDGHTSLKVCLKSTFPRDIHCSRELPGFQEVIDQNHGLQSLHLSERADSWFGKRHYRRLVGLAWTRRVLVSRGAIFVLAVENRLPVRRGHEQAQSE
jgi:hypothetical protein